MGTKFEVTNTGLVKFKQNGTEQFVFENGTSTPVSGVEGQTYYRTDTDQLLIHDGSIFKATLGGSFRIYGEAVNETPNGAITVFSVDNAYVATTTEVTRDGLRMKLGDDYTESAPQSGQITFAVAPSTSSIITVSYSRVEGSALPLMNKFNVVVGTPSSTYSGSTTVFDLPFAYTPGSNSLLVWSAGVLMLVGGANDYVETDLNTITFNTARTVGEVIQFIKIGAANDQVTSGWVDTGTVVSLSTVTDQVQIGSGSAATPSLAFSGYSNLGIFRPAADTLAIATAGVERWRVGSGGNWTSANGTETLRTGDGSAAAPGLSFVNDIDTGFYRDTSNRLTLTLGGTAHWRWEGPTNYPVSDNTVIIGQTTNRPQAIYMADGTAGVPSYTFGAETNTGIWRGAASDMRISTGGVTRLRIRSTSVDTEASQHLFTDGTVGAPSLSFISDPDTGIYRSGANSMILTSGGANRLQIYSGGTEINNGQLFVPNGTAAAPSLTFTGDSDTGFFWQTSNTLSIATGGVARSEFTGGVLQEATGGSLTLWASDGTVGSPSFSFKADQDTGFYRQGANNVSATANGVLQAEFSTLGVGIKDGSAASPSLYFLNGDSDTGLFRQASGVVSITSNGFETNRFGSATTADATLHILQRMNYGGNSVASFFSGQTTTGVSTGGSYIGGVSFGLVMVTGNDGANYFLDLLLASYNSGTPLVIGQLTHQGTPATRSYTSDGTGLKLTMGSGTYAINVIQLDTGVR